MHKLCKCMMWMKGQRIKVVEQRYLSRKSNMMTIQ